MSLCSQSPELEASLAAIRRAQEEAEYNRMISVPSSSSSKPFSLASLSSPSTPYSIYTSGYAQSGQSRLSAREEAAEWKEVQRQIAAMVNVAISAVAVATAAWWAAGNADVAWASNENALLS